MTIICTRAARGRLRVGGESVEYDAYQSFQVSCATDAEARGDARFLSDANRDRGV
jgi:hypothetical protein